MIRTANLTLSISRNAGGLFESVRRLVQSLMETGMDVRVWGLRDEFTDADIPAWQPVPVSAFQPTWPEQFGYSPHFLEELIAFDPDITHTHGIWVYPSIATNHYSRRKQSPYLISTHGMLDRWAIENSRWKKAIAYFMYEGPHLRGARCLRALCEAEARAIRELGFKNDIAIIPNGIDLPKIGDRPVLSTLRSTATEDGRSSTATEGGRSEIGNPPWEGAVEPGRKVLLYLGRIHPKKGLAGLIKAWSEIQKGENRKQKAEGWVLAIAGWDQGGHEAELKCQATELAIPWAEVRRNSELRTPNSELASVVFLGPQFGDARAACYHYCDGFILPSLSEGVPMVVLEAWANSKPVLMTPQCNLPEGFAADAAIRIEPTAESIAQGLHTLFKSSDSDLQSSGSRGQALVTERFVWPRIAEQMKQLYEWMLGGGPRPTCLVDF